jgi:hypothetical protein
MDKPAKLADAATAATEHDVSDEQGAVQAYEQFVARGIGENEALSDWLATERNLRRRLSRATDAARGIAPRDGDSTE